MPLKLIQHEVNKGLGEGIQTGLREGWLSAMSSSSWIPTTRTTRFTSKTW
jgi:hypothetical protein